MVRLASTEVTRLLLVTWTVVLLYDMGPQEYLKFVPRGLDDDIFVRIPHKPVLESAKQQLEAFIKTTFVCCQAAQALAKRGDNIDRCFIGVGPAEDIVISFRKCMATIMPIPKRVVP